MKIDTKQLKRLVEARKRSAEPKPRPKTKSEFLLACEKAGKNPRTIRRRMAPKHEQGQGMTLEEALAAPIKTRSECGTARRAKSSWGRFDGGRS